MVRICVAIRYQSKFANNERKLANVDHNAHLLLSHTYIVAFPSFKRKWYNYESGFLIFMSQENTLKMHRYYHSCLICICLSCILCFSCFVFLVNMNTELILIDGFEVKSDTGIILIYVKNMYT